MVRFSAGGLLVAAGVLLLLHTTWAVIRYREMLKLLQEDYQALPSHILLELAAGTSLAISGAFAVSGPLKAILLPVKGRTMDMHTLRTDFISFNTRSRAMPLDIPPLPQ